MLSFKMKSLALLASLLFIGCGSGSESAAVQPAKNPADVLKISNQQILTAINDARSVARDCHDGQGLIGSVAPLTWNEDLYQAVYEHSNDMAYSNTFSHEGSGTTYDITGSNIGVASLFNERIEANGYVEYRAIGENIAAGQSSLEDVMEEWLVYFSRSLCQCYASRFY